MEIQRTATAETPPMNPLVSRRRPHILLAEDQPEMRRLVALELEAEAYAVEALDSGSALWARCLDGPPVDLIVTDVRMPGLDGLEVLRRLRQRDIDIPVLMVTAFGDRHLHREATALGARVLDKPFDFDHLIAQVADMLGEWGAL